MKKLVTAIVATAALGLLSATAAFGAEGPPIGVFDGQNQAWACATEAGLPPNHCINVNSNGNTGVIKVFSPDPRWPQEGVSTDPKSNDRPCPHDPDATDGTWWSPVPGLWVCHHRP